MHYILFIPNRHISVSLIQVETDVAIGEVGGKQAGDKPRYPPSLWALDLDADSNSIRTSKSSHSALAKQVGVNAALHAMLSPEPLATYTYSVGRTSFRWGKFLCILLTGSRGSHSVNNGNLDHCYDLV